MLKVEGISVGYGAIEVLRDLSFTVPKGKVVALLGGNGAGKTTTMNAIAGLIPLRGGEIYMNGERITRQASHKVFAAGISLVAQSRELFPEMTVRQNLELGVLAQTGVSDVVARVEEIYEMFPRLRERAFNRAASLSGGEQQMLATGRALMARPKLLLLDEPTTGLAPIIVSELQKIIRAVNERGYTVLLVEQNTKMALEVADHVYVLRRGGIALSKPRSEIVDTQEIFDAYLS
ncbi:MULTISPECIES: ABC transporter ATP-binding protein [Chelativorans]|jgi:branched-chain amino acid transport system ATP-binding protein|uniref:Amino acid/amide ABC transporter ATP-binding protein 2, HAAT family n=1 Tax=Chelativorans sp. (strain BNC1) TaxID=266779 RepID=Q11L46_CHESB|nr:MULTISPECIES: ABC transporter ATP-binding protein [Chelativorans]